MIWLVGVTLKPERIAAAARARQTALLGLLAARADAIGDALARSHGLVAWERQKLVGRLQRGLWALRERRFHRLGGPPARVCERREQPLEGLLLVSTLLRQGRRVHLEAEAGASDVAAGLLIELRDELPDLAAEALTIARPLEAPPADVAGWELAGVAPARPRVAGIHPEADPEVAAYTLAIAGLRRGGADPRRVVRALVAGPTERLERHLHRLWVEAAIGPPEDPEVFAGPVEPALAAAYAASLAAWSAVPGTRLLCPGGQLERPGDPRTYLAPAIVRAPAGEPTPATAGPLLVLQACEPAALDAALAACRARGEEILALGPEPWRQRVTPGPQAPLQPLAPGRLPPGLPEPRPT